MRGRQQIILQVAIAVPLRRHFDYLIDEIPAGQMLLPGIRLRVPFGKSKVKTAILLGTAERSEIEHHRLKDITGIIDNEPLFPISHLELLQWASDYYHHPIGEVIFSTIPALLRQGKPPIRKTSIIWRLSDAGKQIDETRMKRAPKQADFIRLLRTYPDGLPHSELNNRNWQPVLKALQKKGFIEKTGLAVTHNSKSSANSNITLNPDQNAAVNSVKANIGQYQRFLLNGVTGSGKTEVYINIIKHVIHAGRQALILVPEIGLTPQLIRRMEDRIQSRIVVLHSALSDGERLQAWLDARDGHASVVLGTRSAIWTPLKRAGVFIIDEEHDLSYKQQDSFRYSARDIAIMRAKMLNIPVVLGSATPSLESLQNISNGRFIQLKLSGRAGNARPPEINLIDMRAQQMTGAFSKTLLDAIDDKLKQHQQILLFLNKRGFSPVVMCHTCGWIAKCERCNIHMIYHKHYHRLSCHHCGKQTPLLKTCPGCGAPELLNIGHGTERLTETLTHIFPGARIVRIDRDTTRRKGGMKEMLDAINAGDADILVGTQMLAKGHHFANLTLVGVIDADSGLFSTDFRSSERMAQLIVQVSGRSGRSVRHGSVLIQTHFPRHPLLLSLVHQDYPEFARILLKEREQSRLPPFSYLALLRAEDYHAGNVQDFLADAKSLIEEQSHGIEIFGPLPAPMEKRAGRLRFQILIQSEDRLRLNHALGPWSKALESLPGAKKVRWSLDVDPLDVL
ncbi:MAG: primosomal protein N' [Gammaproteobacteria bacterium]